ncbi:M-phase phosphoprotein 8 [Histomonas meleagridis]|uniref:M-phase phosphoprotein 8 n=1 Tax=Histomonas meleagridis TaxID=135588 RepID=UPI00355A0E80|nr:M-phase phosphoprotein 8 [Histomonas meleagridis]KAH0806750.1 M-phase phosphoprotein 8 [Histomonas meleagridis]
MQSEEEGDDIFEVEKIISHKTIDGVTYFQIRWKGYPPEEDTFEPIENLNCPDVIRQYYKSISSTNKDKPSTKKERKEKPQEIKPNSDSSQKRIKEIEKPRKESKPERGRDRKRKKEKPQEIIPKKERPNSKETIKKKPEKPAHIEPFKPYRTVVVPQQNFQIESDDKQHIQFQDHPFPEPPPTQPNSSRQMAVKREDRNPMIIIKPEKKLKKAKSKDQLKILRSVNANFRMNFTLAPLHEFEVSPKSEITKNNMMIAAEKTTTLLDSFVIRRIIRVINKDGKILVECEIPDQSETVVIPLSYAQFLFPNDLNSFLVEQ